MNFLFIYLAIINMVAFFAYGTDKAKAKFHRWRIPEASLLGLAFIGGSLGALAGMQLFKHKTKHMKFKVLVPVFLIIHVMVLFLITNKL